MILRIDALVKRFGGRRVLDGIDLTLDGPGSWALLGENGSGKSTLLRCASGVLEPDEGRVTLDGDSIHAASGAPRRRLGYVPEAAEAFPHLTVAELVGLVGSLKSAGAPAPGLVERLGLAPLLSQRVGTLSLGQRRRASLLLALVGDPALLLLDEPTNGLDAEGLAFLLEFLRTWVGAGGAVLTATHDRAFAAALGARSLCLKGGRLSDEENP